MSKSHKSPEFHKLGPEKSESFTLEDFLIIIFDEHTNFELRTGNGLRLSPFQINNAHPKFPGQTVAVYEIADLNQPEAAADDPNTGSRGSDRDIDIIPPPDPFP
ncbi:hypothetical protein QA596_09355 [Balneolales bacterium ANBcel1]|nr:hypothetical protein [Balneolales bacterium ANBcel1]